MPRPPTPTVSLVEVMSLPKTTVSPRRLAVISESGRNSGASQAERHALLLSDYTADILCDASKQIEATVGDIATLAQSVRLLFIPALTNVAVVTSQYKLVFFLQLLRIHRCVSEGLVKACISSPTTDQRVKNLLTYCYYAGFDNDDIIRMLQCELFIHSPVLEQLPT